MTSKEAADFIAEHAFHSLEEGEIFDTFCRWLVNHTHYGIEDEIVDWMETAIVDFMDEQEKNEKDEDKDEEDDD